MKTLQMVCFNNFLENVGSGTRTNFIYGVKKNLNIEHYENIYQEGLKSFRIDCAQMNQAEYSHHVRIINEIFSKHDDVAEILFEIKGPMPLITRIGIGNEFLNLKKGEIIRICYDYRTRIYEEGILYIDKKITNGLTIGDVIFINSSNVKLKVIGFERSSHQNFTSKKNNFKNFNFSNSSPFLLGRDERRLVAEEKKIEHEKNLDYDNYFDDVDESQIIFENQELLNADNFDNNFEEKLKNKQQKMTAIYNNYIRKFSMNKDDNKTNGDLDRLSVISQISSSMMSEIDPCMILLKKEKLRRASCCSSENSKLSNRLVCEVIQEGVVHKYRTFNIYEKDIVFESEIPYIHAKDIVDISKAYSLGVTTISVFANSPENLDEVKEILCEEASKKLKIFSRIETQEAIRNFNNILAKSDGIILHHGLITSVVPFEDVNLVEIYMIQKCKLQNKPIFIKNFSFKTLNINKPLLSKFSFLDLSAKEGIDSIIIEDDTQTEGGLIDNIRICREVLRQIESYEDSHFKYQEMSKFFSLNKNKNLLLTDSIFDCVSNLSYEIKPEYIIIFLDQELMIKSLVNYRPFCPILLPSSNHSILKYARTLRGVIPILIKDKDIKNMYFPEEHINLIFKSLEHKNLIRLKSVKFIVVNAFSNSSIKYKNGFFIVDHQFTGIC
jgi:pyruvate kinase